MHPEDPNATPDDIKARLMAMASKDTLNPDGSPADFFIRGAGLINLYTAIQAAGKIV